MSRIHHPIAAIAALVTLAGCASGMPTQEPTPSGNRVNQLLSDRQVVFGYFPRNPNPEQAASLAGNAEIDFIMMSQEEELDVPALQAYTQAMRDASTRAGVAPIPILLRVPPIEDAAVTRQRVEQAAAGGAAGIVFPHVSRAQQAEISVDVMRDRDLAHFLIVEEPEGVTNVRDIADTPGLSVVFAGPGTMRQTFKGDMTAVENAIQTVLGACKASNVACGITAGPNDIEKRLQEGFRVIIVYDLAALPIGRRAAGRTN